MAPCREATEIVLASEVVGERLLEGKMEEDQSIFEVGSRTPFVPARIRSDAPGDPVGLRGAGCLFRRRSGALGFVQGFRENSEVANGRFDSVLCRPDLKQLLTGGATSNNSAVAIGFRVVSPVLRTRRANGYGDLIFEGEFEHWNTP